MKKKWVERVVARWVKLLKLEAWELQVIWPDKDGVYKEWPENEEGFPKFDDKQAYAAVWQAKDYDNARIYVNTDKWASTGNRVLEATIIHELLHIVTREAEFVLHMIDGMLQREVDEMVGRAHEHALEGIVDRLAFRLLEIAGPTK